MMTEGRTFQAGEIASARPWEGNGNNREEPGGEGREAGHEAGEAGAMRGQKGCWGLRGYSQAHASVYLGPVSSKVTDIVMLLRGRRLQREARV